MTSKDFRRGKSAVAKAGSQRADCLASFSGLTKSLGDDAPEQERALDRSGSQ
jgi:hypothetical protein